MVSMLLFPILWLQVFQLGNWLPLHTLEEASIRSDLLHTLLKCPKYIHSSRSTSSTWARSIEDCLNRRTTSTMISHGRAILGLAYMTSISWGRSSSTRRERTKSFNLKYLTARTKWLKLLFRDQARTKLLFQLRILPRSIRSRIQTDNLLDRSLSHSWLKPRGANSGSMRARLLIPDRRFLRILGPVSIITRKRRMILKTRLLQKRQFMLPSTVVMTGPATRKLKHLIQDQAPTSISIIRPIAQCRPRYRIGTKRRGLSRKNKELSLDHLDQTLTGSSSLGWIRRLDQIQANIWVT